MSVGELKKVITEKIDKLNEEQLKVILKIIEKADVDYTQSKFDVQVFFEEAVAKYGNVLQKLAQ